MNKLFRLFFFLSISTVFFSCEKEVVLDFGDDEQRMAIFSLFSPNDIFTSDHNFNVEITATQSILDNSPSMYVNGARVTIATEPLLETTTTSSGSGDIPQNPQITSEEAISYSVSDTERIIYRTDNTIPSDGFSYKLTVDHPDYPKVTAESYVPKTTRIENLELSDFKTTKENQLEEFTRYFSQASFELDNDFNQTAQYHLLVWLGYPIGGGQNVYTPVTIEEDVLMEQLGADATIVNSNSSLVFFGAHFDNSTFEETTQKLNFDIGFSLHDDEYPTSIRIELRSVSEQYHNYFVEGFRLSQSGSNQFFSSSNSISNNIEGGFGVFAGYSVNDVEVPFRK